MFLAKLSHYSACKRKRRKLVFILLKQFLSVSFEWQEFTSIGEKKNHTLQLIEVNPFSLVFYHI